MLSEAALARAVALGVEASRRHIPIVDDEGCNFFCIDGEEAVSNGSCSSKITFGTEGPFRLGPRV